MHVFCPCPPSAIKEGQNELKVLYLNTLFILGRSRYLCCVLQQEMYFVVKLRWNRLKILVVIRLALCFEDSFEVVEKQIELLHSLWGDFFNMSCVIQPCQN